MEPLHQLASWELDQARYFSQTLRLQSRPFLHSDSFPPSTEGDSQGNCDRRRHKDYQKRDIRVLEGAAGQLWGQGKCSPI